MAVDQVTDQVVITEAHDADTQGRFVAVSDDHGRTWSTPRPIAPARNASGPVTMAHGVVGVAYTYDPSSGTNDVACTAACMRVRAS
jgi:hypothetical protein